MRKRPSLRSRIIFQVVRSALVSIFLVVGFYFFARDNDNLQLLLTPLWEPRAQQEKLDIHTIAISNEHGFWHLERKGKQWMILQPIESPIQAQSIHILTQQLFAPVSKQSLGTLSPDKLKEMGLAPPKMRIQVQLADQSLRTFQVGDLSAISNQQYALLDQRAYLLPQEVFSAASQPLSFFVERGLFTVPIRDMTRILLTNLSGIAIDLRKTNNAWTLNNQPVQQRALDILLYSMGAMSFRHLIEIHPTNMQQYGLDQPRAFLQMGDDEGSDSIQVGNLLTPNATQRLRGYYAWLPRLSAVVLLSEESVLHYLSMEPHDFLSNTATHP